VARNHRLTAAVHGYQGCTCCEEIGSVELLRFMLNKRWVFLIVNLFVWLFLALFRAVLGYQG